MHVEQVNPGAIQAVELKLDALGRGDGLSRGKGKISPQIGTENRPEGLRCRVQGSKEEDHVQVQARRWGPWIK